MWYVIAFFGVWTFASFWWFFSLLGEHYRKAKWYDYPLSIPFMAIATTIGFIRTIFERKK